MISGAVVHPLRRCIREAAGSKITRGTDPADHRGDDLLLPGESTTAGPFSDCHSQVHSH